MAKEMRCADVGMDCDFVARPFVPTMGETHLK